MSRGTLGFFAYLFGIIGFFVFMFHYDEETRPVCVSNAKVKEILSVQYREATFLLDNGQIETYIQATLKPGDIVCTQWSDRLPFFGKKIQRRLTNKILALD